MRFGVVIFPGSNCDQDTIHALEDVLSVETVALWHADEDLKGADVVIVPGGFSFGDYLRSGAIAKFSPIMKAVRRHAVQGNLVLGICNGFQILQEAGLLHGVLLRNAGLKFLCQDVHLRIERSDTSFTRCLKKNQVITLPIAHNDGNFFAQPELLAQMEDRGQVILRYCSSDGTLAPESNPNGSLNSIAGITNEDQNVLGMMPHPERLVETLLGGTDGLSLFNSVVESLECIQA